MTPKPSFAVAFPVAEAQRDLIRQMAPDTPLPALYRDGVENRPCSSCGMTLNVGPRVLAALATGIPLYCLVCVNHLTASLGVTPVTVESLDNPESRPEDRPTYAPGSKKVS